MLLIGSSNHSKHAMLILSGRDLFQIAQQTRINAEYVSREPKRTIERAVKSTPAEVSSLNGYMMHRIMYSIGERARVFDMKKKIRRE